MSETEKARPSNQRFVGVSDSMEDSLKQSTVGLVHLNDFVQRRQEIEEAKKAGKKLRKVTFARIREANHFVSDLFLHAGLRLTHRCLGRYIGTGLMIPCGRASRRRPSSKRS